MRRKALTLAEKRQVLRDKPYCFICGIPVSDENIAELDFDHIRSLEAGGSNDLMNFAGVHKKCHKGKGTKSLEDYKEDLRLEKEFSSLLRFTDVTDTLNPSDEKLGFQIDLEKKEIRLGDSESIRLYQCPNTKIWYFYYPINRKYLVSDVDVQPRGLEHKRLRELTLNLRRNFQLSPTVCRLITSEGKIKVFDGQHKATAQALGNQNAIVDCKVFIDPPLEMVRRVVIEGHGPLRQQEFKTSELFRKLTANFRELLKQWQDSHPGRLISEFDLPQALGKSVRESEKDVVAYTTESIYEDSNCEIVRFVSEERRPGRQPMSYDMFAWWVNLLIKRPLISEPMESEQNFREDERGNIIRLFNIVTQYCLQDKWTPENPVSTEYRKIRKLFYRASFREWTKLINDALRILMYLRSDDPVFYRRVSLETWDRIEAVSQKLVGHPIWMDTNPQVEATLNSNVQSAVAELFNAKGLDPEYLCKRD